MRLLIATPLYLPELGGPATYTKLLEEGLPGLGIDVTVVKFGDVRHLPKVVSHIVYAWKVFRAGLQTDVILSLDALSVGWPALFANFFLRKRFAVKIVGDHIWEQGKQRFGVTSSLDESRMFSWHPYLAFLRVLQQLTMRAANRVIVPSEYLKKLVCSWGIRADKVTVIYNAIALTENGQAPEAVQQLPHPRIVTVARLVPWKGIDGLIDAIAQLRDINTNVSLIIVGEGPERSRLEARARKQLRNGFVFTGPLRPEDVHATLRESDIFVLNSTYEGLSHVLIEALMVGLPIVATRAGGNSEVLTEESGVLIPVGDTMALATALVTLLQDPELSVRLRKGALERATAFSVPSMLERTKEVLSTML